MRGSTYLRETWYNILPGIEEERTWWWSKHPSTRIARVSQWLQRWHQNIFTSKLWNSNTEMYSDRLSKKIALTFVKLNGGPLIFQWGLCRVSQIAEVAFIGSSANDITSRSEWRSLHFRGNNQARLGTYKYVPKLIQRWCSITTEPPDCLFQEQVASLTTSDCMAFIHPSMQLYIVARW